MLNLSVDIRHWLDEYREPAMPGYPRAMITVRRVAMICAICACWIACVGSRPPASPSPMAAAVLELGHPIERDIRRGEVQTLSVTLEAGQVLLGTVDQHGVDVNVSTLDPDGKQLADIETGAPKVVVIEARAAGTYRIEIRPHVVVGPDGRPTDPFTRGDLGRYEARIDEVTTAATYADREARAVRELAAFWDQHAPVVASFVSWAQEHAIRFDTVDAAKASGTEDLAPIATVIGTARVVSLGEADHGIHEYLAFRNRLLQFLVTHLGFTAIVAETGFAESTAVDDFVTGKSTASGRSVAGNVFSWALPATFPENVELVEWLKAHNADPRTTRKVHFYGMDFTGGRNGLLTESRRSLDDALAYLATADAPLHRELTRALAPFLDKFDELGYLALTAVQRDALTIAIADLIAALERTHVALVARSSAADYQRASHNAVGARTIDAFLRDSRGASFPTHLVDPRFDGIRDAAMARNIMWALEQEGPSGRVLVYSHNAHATKGPMLRWPLAMPIGASMGQHATSQLGSDLVVIGFTRGDGADSATMDGLLHRVGLPQFVVDLRGAAASSPVLHEALDRSWGFRYEVFRNLNLPPTVALNPLASYDALVYVDQVTPVVPITSAIRGRVTHRGRVVAGAEVLVNIPPYDHVTSDADGRFELRGVRGGQWMVVATSRDKLAGGEHPVQMHGDDIVADVELDLEATIAGQVTDDRGQPVPGARVTASCCRDTDSGDATTDAGGRFMIGALLGGDAYTVTVIPGDGLMGVASVRIRDRTDHATGVRLIVRRVPRAR